MHFTHKTACKTLYNEDWDSPPPDTLLFHADFLEHDQLPVGPKETGKFFYANSVLGVTLLVIIVWSESLEKTYYTFCSGVREQSSLFVVACLEHILTLLDIKQYKRIKWWSDVGPHFLSSRWVGYWLYHMVKKHRVHSTINFFPAGHGKGACDAHGGRFKKWKRTAAKKMYICSVEGYVRVMSDKAKVLKTQTPDCPHYVFIDFDPPAKNSLPRTVLDSADLRANGMGLRQTHCYSSEWKSWCVVLRRHPVPGAPHNKQVHGPSTIDHDADDDANAEGPWQRYYRINKPEQLNICAKSLLTTWRADKKVWQRQRLELRGRRYFYQQCRYGH
jgi:hypothetical protein